MTAHIRPENFILTDCSIYCDI